MDKTFLEEKYQVLHEAVQFFEDFLIEDEKGQLVSCPSVSPENTCILKNGEHGCMCAGSTMDTEISEQPQQLRRCWYRAIMGEIYKF